MSLTAQCVPKNKVTLTRARTAKIEEKDTLPTGNALFELSKLKNSEKAHFFAELYHNDVKETGCLRNFSYHFMKLNVPSHSVRQCVIFALQMFSCPSGVLPTRPPHPQG